jgi:hypothetical protein
LLLYCSATHVLLLLLLLLVSVPFVSWPLEVLLLLYLPALLITAACFTVPCRCPCCGTAHALLGAGVTAAALAL